MLRFFWPELEQVGKDHKRKPKGSQCIPELRGGEEEEPSLTFGSSFSISLSSPPAPLNFFPPFNCLPLYFFPLFIWKIFSATANSQMLLEHLQLILLLALVLQVLNIVMVCFQELKVKSHRPPLTYCSPVHSFIHSKDIYQMPPRC